MKIKRLAILITITIHIGCATYTGQFTREYTDEDKAFDSKLLKTQKNHAESVAKSYMNSPVEDLLKAVPNIKVEEYSKDKFRYTTRYEVLSTIREVKIDYRLKAYMEIIFFSDDEGKITDYQISRRVY